MGGRCEFFLVAGGRRPAADWRRRRPRPAARWPQPSHAPAAGAVRTRTEHARPAAGQGTGRGERAAAKGERRHAERSRAAAFFFWLPPPAGASFPHHSQLGVVVNVQLLLAPGGRVGDVELKRGEKGGGAEVRRGGSTVGRRGRGLSFPASGRASAAAGGCRWQVRAQRTFMVAGRGHETGDSLAGGGKANGGVKSRLSVFVFGFRGRLYRGDLSRTHAHTNSLSLSLKLYLASAR